MYVYIINIVITCMTPPRIIERVFDNIGGSRPRKTRCLSLRNYMLANNKIIFFLSVRLKYSKNWIIKVWW